MVSREQWFEQVWAEREETVYRALFGDIGKEIHTIPASVFDGMGKHDPDPRFLTHGVLECPPTDMSAMWTYVSSGMSNPWGEGPEDVGAGKMSGLGFEFALHTRERVKWGIALVQWVMAAQLLIASGEAKGDIIEYGDWIPLGRPLLGQGEITHLLVTKPEGYPDTFELASGRVDMMLLLGVTQREAEFVRGQGADALIALLKHREVFPITDPLRTSMV